MKISGFVTVIVPVRNGALTIRRCLEAIAAQTYRPLEIVVVDDGSTDATPGWVRSFRANHPGVPVQIVTQAAQGQGAALKAGLQRARGEFLALAESGDEWHPDKLARQVAQLQGNAKLTVSAGEVAFKVGEADELPVAAPRKLLFELVPLSSLVMRRDAVEAVGGFDAAPAIAPAHALCYRLAQRGPMARLRHAALATCHRKERPVLPTAQLAATLEALSGEGHFSAKQLKLSQSRLYALQGWQALFAEEPERAREAFETAMAANPWLPVTWVGMGLAQIDQWLFTAGILKPHAKGQQLVHAKR
jgi:hypothetical protein